jgi:hypothetical protein
MTRGWVAGATRRDRCAPDDRRMVEMLRENPVAAVIVACEVGLWVLLLAGLVARYPLRLRVVSTVLLASIPLLDVVLVVAVALDLHRGEPAGWVHGVAGIYLGVSVAFGPAIVRWADVRFAHRFAGGPAPVPVPRRGPQRRAHLWREWSRVVTAATIASVVLAGLALLFGPPEQDPVLYGWIGRCWVVVGIWLVAGPLWESGTSRERSRA